MRRFDLVGGWFVRLGRFWFGLVADFPFVVRVPVIAGGTAGVDEAMASQQTYLEVADVGSPEPGSPGSPEDWTEIAHIVNIPGPNETAEDIDVTHLRTVGSYRQFIPSFKDPGELTLDCNFLPGNSTHQLMDSIYQAQTTRLWRITYPDGSRDIFHGYVKGKARAAAVGSKLSATYTIRIVGQVILDAAA